MTKKQRILNLFESIPWHNDTKGINYDHLRNNDFETSVEHGQKWGDVYYIMRVLRKEGYTVLLGNYSICIYRNK